MQLLRHSVRTALRTVRGRQLCRDWNYRSRDRLESTRLG